jgi:hypothetical protein
MDLGSLLVCIMLKHCSIKRYTDQGVEKKIILKWLSDKYIVKV